MDHVFELNPISQSAHLFFAIITVLMVGLGALFGWLYLGSRHISVAVNSTELKLNAPIYGRSIALADIILDDARVTDLAREQQLLPKRRTNGIGMPGFSLGWFKLRSGRKAWLAVTSRQRVVYLPTRLDYDILISARWPELLLQQLKAVQ